jgi:AraC-like DNA-binding protein
MNYRLLDHHSSPLSGAYLHDLYELSNNADHESIYCCMPDGMLGITVILSGECWIDVDGCWEKQSAASVYGLITKHQFIKMGSGYRELTIGFYPHVFQSLTTESMSSLLKRNATDLCYLFDRFIVEQLVTQLQQAANDAEILAAIETFILSTRKDITPDRRIAEAFRLISRSSVNQVCDLSSALALSTTGIRTLFKDRVGLSPKDLIKVVRIRKALNHCFGDEQSLTQLAYDLNYFDQSHFIHDFKEAIGLSPKQYFKNKELTFDFYNYSRLQLSSFAHQS